MRYTDDYILYTVRYVLYTIGDTGAERDILLWLAGAHNNPVRMEVFNQLEVARENIISNYMSFYAII